ncbi:MAG TPA: HAMP domain-containing sensor histidine kinase [Gaiellaceae bacterium]|nr:HAMP domain-containing sensor histidine kinase [Gaiellaceae bacterium]
MRTKLVASFLVIAGLLVLVAVLGLRDLGRANGRVEHLDALQLRASAYQALEAYATDLRQMLGVRAAGQPTETAYTHGETLQGGRQWILSDDDAAFALTQVALASNEAHFGFVPSAADERLLGRIHRDYRIVDRAVAKIRALDTRGVGGYKAYSLLVSATDADDDLADQATDLGERTNNATSLLVQANRRADASSADLFVGVAAASVLLALGLGLVLAVSLIGPIRRTEARLAEIASGDFSGRLDVPNRDELGSLAANVNRMNDELRRLYGELETASRHKSEFLAHMSHELRTPLNAIIGFSQVLRERMFGEINAKQEEYLDDVLSSGNHLLSLINDVLDLAKVEAGHVELELTTVSLRDALERCVVMMRERAAEGDVRLVLAVAQGVDTVVADERRLRQIVFNLLSNAVKFTPPGGSVVVAAERTAAATRVSVSDTGPGVAPADRERIFEEFQQTELGERTGEGTGLGLSLSRRLVELHGGRIWVEDAPGGGSTFAFTLPAEA